MPVRIVQSKQNPRLKELRSALAHPDQANDGSILAAIEGPKLLAEALRSQLRLVCVFVAQGQEALLDELLLPPQTDVLLVPKEILDSSLSTETPQSIAALVEPPKWDWADLLPISPTTVPLLLILASLQDPGNLGTILRSAEAFGATGILSLPGTVSAWNSKAVRASAGSLFRLPLLSVSADECIERLRQAGVKIWTTALHNAQAAERINLAEPVAIIIGNEGSGVPQELASQADGALRIPCSGPVESLNASVACSILLYEISRQRA
ncbi:MAG: RNA methyltransferase [Terracidiphilus sp.]|jgi:TrmH family RNA methyltransferase